MIDYTPSNLTSDSCSAHVETFRYQVLDHNNVGKYFTYWNRRNAELSNHYKSIIYFALIARNANKKSAEGNFGIGLMF